MVFRSCHLYQIMTENDEPRSLLTQMTVFELAYCPLNLSLEIGYQEISQKLS